MVFEGGSKVGKGVGTSVGLDGSIVGSAVAFSRVGMSEVGVNVAVAKRSCVGILVTVGAGVKVSAGGRAVGVVGSCSNGARLEHPLVNKAVRTRNRRSFFMEEPFARSGIEDFTMCERNLITRDHGASDRITGFIQSNELELQPGIFKGAVAGDLVQVDGVEIDALVIIA